MSKKIVVLLFVFVGLLQFCNTTEPPSAEKTITLTLEDAASIEAWIKLTTTNLQLPTTITLKQSATGGDLTRSIINLVKADTLLYIDSLLPNKTYSFHATIQPSNHTEEVKSNVLSLTTMDTTSHNFTWQTWTFGEHGSSVLYDVAIIDENNIWAVGEIYLNDSLGQSDPKRYNAAIWNGSNWSIQRVPYYYQGQPFYHPIQSVFVFGPNDIWFCGNGVIHWDGNSFIPIPIPTNVWGPYQMNKLWGSSSNDLYVVGTNGKIAHYQNGSWSKIVSGTTLGLGDIYGNENGKIYACGGNLSTGEGVVLKINSNNTATKIIDSYYYGTGFDSTTMFTENLYGPLMGIWVAENSTVYTVGNLIYRYNNGIWDYAKGIEYNYLSAGPFTGRGASWSVRGKGNNDFIFVGERNTIRHFNGISAAQLGEPFSYTSEYHWSSVDYKQNIAVTAGRKGGYASVIIFRN